MKKSFETEQEIFTNIEIYYVKKNPAAPKEEVEWLRVSRGEFFRIMEQKYEGQKRCFEVLKKTSNNDNSPVIYIEDTVVEWRSLQKDRHHNDYIHEQAQKVDEVSLEKYQEGKDEKDDRTREIGAEMNLTERIELEKLKAALRSKLKGLDKTSHMLADIYYIEFKQKVTQEEMAARIGISQPAVSQRLKVIEARLQKYHE